jgi:hypothetical protein
MRGVTTARASGDGATFKATAGDAASEPFAFVPFVLPSPALASFAGAGCPTGGAASASF